MLSDFEKYLNSQKEEFKNLFKKNNQEQSQNAEKQLIKRVDNVINESFMSSLIQLFFPKYGKIIAYGLEVMLANQSTS